MPVVVQVLCSSTYMTDLHAAARTDTSPATCFGTMIFSEDYLLHGMQIITVPERKEMIVVFAAELVQRRATSQTRALHTIQTNNQVPGPMGDILMQRKQQRQVVKPDCHRKHRRFNFLHNELLRRQTPACGEGLMPIACIVSSTAIGGWYNLALIILRRRLLRGRDRALQRRSTAGQQQVFCPKVQLPQAKNTEQSVSLKWRIAAAIARNM